VYKKGIDKFLESKEDMKEYLRDQIDHMEEFYGVYDKDEQQLMLAFFLYNCHDTISSIAHECTNGKLSKSTYDKNVYISEINSAQQKSYETMFFEDIEDFVEGCEDKIDKEEFMEFLKEYFSNRDTWREVMKNDN